MEHINVNLPRNVWEILKQLNKAGHEAYIVGGCVRDLIMNRVPNDWDITTSATPEKVKKVFPKTYDTGLEHGTVTVRIKKETYEVTTYRTEGKYEDHRRPKEVEFVEDITLDLSRRDFTMNAIAYHPKEGFIDPYLGVNDIKAKTIKAVGNPKERFEEDALRILRGARFSAQLGFEIEQKTLESMIEKSNLLDCISKERIRDEFIKMLLSDKEEIFIQMYKWGILKYIIPELIPAFETPQNHPHHKYNVGVHTIKALEEVPKELVIRLATLLHDIGKPKSHTTDENGIDHFRGHVEISAKMANTILRRLRFDNNTIKQVVALVKYHDFHIQEELTRNSIKEVLCSIGPELFEKLMLIQEADARAQNPDKLEPKLENLKKTKYVFKDILDNKECYSLKELAINGKDIKDIGIKDGKQIGKILNDTLKYVMEYPDKNKKEHLIDKIKKKYD